MPYDFVVKGSSMLSISVCVKEAFIKDLLVIFLASEFQENLEGNVSFLQILVNDRF